MHDWRFIYASVYIESPGEWRVYQCANCYMVADAPLPPDIVDMDAAIARIEPWLKGDTIMPCQLAREYICELRG